MSLSKKLSVIIPTYNRAGTLLKTLRALNNQTLPRNEYEVVLVDDGSTEDLASQIPSESYSYPIHIYRQDHRGPAAARNLGAQNAHGEVLLFLDSDMIADPDLLLQHRKTHQHHPGSLVVGPRSQFPGNEALDPLQHFDYRPDGTDLRFEKQPLTFQEAFTCNLSIRCEDWQTMDGFDERMPSFEDIEFAYRVVKGGLSIVLNPAALCYHDHITNLKERCSRATSYTRTVPLLFQKHPELAGQIVHLRSKEPIDWKQDSLGLIARKLARRGLAFSPILHLMEWAFQRLHGNRRSIRWQQFLYWKIIGSYQWIGLQEGERIYR